MGQFMDCSRSPLRIVVWLCTCTLLAVALLPGGGRIQAAPTSATSVEVSASQPVVGSTPGLPCYGEASSEVDAATTPAAIAASVADVEVGEAMVTPAALMELLPHEKQQHKEQMLKHQEMVERLRVENEKRLWEEREALRLAYALEDSDEETTTTEPPKTTQPSTTDVTLPGGKRRRTENPILKKFKISNSRGIMVFRSVPTTPRIFTTRKPRITTQPATTSTTTTTTTPATPSTEAATTAKEVEDITTMQATPSTTTTTEARAPIATTEITAETTSTPIVSKPAKLNTTTATVEATKASMATSTPTSLLGYKTTAPYSTENVDKVTSASTSSPEVSTSSISLLSIELESPELNSIPSTQEEPVYSEPSNSLTTTDLTDNLKDSPVAPVNSAEMQNDQPMFDLDDENSLQSVHEPADDLKKASDALLSAMEHEKESLAGDPIDMKSHNAKMLEEAHKVREAKGSDDGSGSNAGHDGVKITKKKQLVDSHAEGFDVSMGEVNGGEAVPKVLVRSDDKAEKEAKKVNAMPLKPVRNGFLGPLIMGEKIYSIGSRPAKPQKLKHEASIESQLRQGRIVEIIPPTAALPEQEEAMSSSMTTTTKTAPATSLATETPTEATSAAPVPSTMEPIVQPTATSTAEEIFTTPSAIASTEAATEKDDIAAAATTTTLEPFSFSPTAMAEKFSSTVFQVVEGFSSTTRLPSTASNPDNNESTAQLANAEQTESKISDIQIEVYDSTVDSIVASTNFKDGDSLHLQEAFQAGGGTTKPPISMVTQERFTQYVIDRTDTSTPESYLDLSQVTGGVGKPEPAAIEIHINVSEGISSSDTEDLEFAYPQTDYQSETYRAGPKAGYSQISLKPFADGGSSAQNYANPSGGSTNSDEILVVEIIDTGENNTDQSSASSENINPVFTFRSGSDTEEEPLPKAVGASSTDELFLADVKKDEISGSSYLHPPPPPPAHHRSPVDRDSDTIFYISNTEVKVGESLPPAAEQEQERRSQMESQFYPVSYVASTHPNAGPNSGKGDADGEGPQRRYEEDIILSPVRNTADSLKIFRSEADVVGGDNAAPPPDVTYVGESIMEVEQLPSPGMTAPGGMTITATQQQQPQQQQSDVIIQPGMVPEMSIGVPVIGELPPQIELKEIDFMPDEASQLRSAGYESNSIGGGGGGNSNNNDDSIQYGGDLIDLGASSSFDGAEGAYPFGDGSEYAGLHYVHSHGGSHLRRDELTADIGGSGETNDTLKEVLANATLATGNDTAAGGMGPLAERRINTSTTDASDQMTNGTDAVFSERGEKDWKHTVGFTIGLFFVLTPVVVTVSMACALRYLYYKYHGNSPDSTEANDNEAGNHNAGANGRTGESTQPPSPSPSDGDGKEPPKPPTQHNLNTNSNSLGKPSNNDFINLETIDEKSNDAHTDNSQTESKSTADSVGTLGAAEGGGGVVCGGDYVGPHRTQQQKQQQHKLKQQLTLLTTSVHGGASGVGGGRGGASGRGRGGASGGGPNGSVTKMTLKNNHLIVETEERNDISRNARETKMTYNGTDKDSIFVVEVSRGIDSKAIPESPNSENSDHHFPGLEPKAKCALPLKDIAKDADVGPIPKHQQVEVHPPPPDVETTDKVRSLQKIAEVEEEHHHQHEHGAEAALERNCKTGLSQSDLSSTSSTDSNKRYSYGNQELYVIEPAGYDAAQPAAFTTAAVHVSREAQRDDDHKSENGHSLGFCPEQKTEGEELAEKNEEASETAEAKGAEGEQGKESLETIESAQNEGQAEVASNEAQIEAAEIEPEIESSPTEEPQIEAAKIEPQTEATETEVTQSEAPNEVTQSEAPNEMTQIEPQMEAVSDKVDTHLDLSAVDIIPPPLEDADTKESAALNGPKETDPDDSEPSTEANVTEAGIPPITTEMPEDTTSLAVPDLVRDLQTNGHVGNGLDMETAESDADEADNAMDSIISLPDPPSTEEIKRFNGEDGDQTSLLDTNQLDSLPPPPPPLADEPADVSPLGEDQLNGYDMEMTIPAPACFDNGSTATTETAVAEATTRNATIVEKAAAAATNGNCNGHEQMNGHDDNCNDEKNAARSKEQIAAPEAVQVAKLLESLPPPTGTGAARGADIVGAAVDNGNCNGKMMAAASPLTPPASPTTQSPPPKTQLQYGATTATTMVTGAAVANGGVPLCQPLLPVAVDVNGS